MIRKVILTTLVLASFATVKGQVSISSPYSYFGVGTVNGVSSQLGSSIGMATTAYSSPYFINPSNPATYIAFDTNSFVFDAAFSLGMANLKTIDMQQKTRNGSLSNIYFGFPVTRWWRTSFGMMPYSHVGYQIEDKQTDELIGNRLTTYIGSGGINRVYWGNAFSPFKGFSVGVNVQYLFGTIEKRTTVTFPDSLGPINTMDKSNARISQLNFDAGILYKYTKPNGKFFQVGLTFNPKQDLNGSANRDIYSYNLNASNLEVIGDSIYHFEGTKQLITLPTALGAGICTGSTNRWFLSLDASYSKWTEFRYLGSNPQLKDQLRVSLGGQFRPSPVDIGKYYERINYRAGVKYQQSYLEINNTRLNEVGVSFGFGLPMKKSKSTINIAVEMGTAGTTDNNLIKENYFKITIGSALQERWFLKNRYN